MSWQAVVFALCWGSVIVVWVVGAIDSLRNAPKVETRAGAGVIPIALVIVAILIFAPIHWDSLSFGSTGLAVIGAIILIASTVFTIWSRFALGSMWSANAVARVDHELRTSGPYAVTRHPIYTGLIGMVLGTALVSGNGEWILILVAVIVVLAARAVREEHVMASTFPHRYEAYRKRVPGFVPRPRIRHHGT
jgi:protein-S-isoprenylcysteine O-methyltransferase Ste14